MFEAKPLGERDVRGALFVTVQVGDVTINISSPRPNETMGPADAGLHYGLEHIAFSTDDLDQDLAHLKEWGGQVLQTMSLGSGKIACVEGPDGVRIELMQI
jgi:catechol 2,3-dioxygenase-like lactoylglutathione lyase family enzyme